MVESILPKGYVYKILKSSMVSPESFSCEFRCNIDNELEFSKWLKEFQSSTNTYWIVRHSVSSKASLFRLSRDYLCQHSSYRKKKEDGKDKKCVASLSVRMKRNSKFICYRDHLAREGFFTIIKINFNHSHSINDNEISGWLPRTDKTKQIFIDYFDAGMSPAASKKYHETVTLADSPELLCNSSINPPASWIYSRYQKWLEHRKWLQENVGGLIFSEPVVPIFVENAKTEMNFTKPANDQELDIADSNKTVEPDEQNVVVPDKNSQEISFEYFSSGNTSSSNGLINFLEPEDPLFVENIEIQNCKPIKNRTIEEIPYSHETESKSEKLQDSNAIVTEAYNDEEMTFESLYTENMSPNMPDKFEIVPKFCYQMDRIAHIVEKSDDNILLCLVDKFADKASKVSSVSDLYDFFDTILINHVMWEKKSKAHYTPACRNKGLSSRKSLTFQILKQNAVKRKKL